MGFLWAVSFARSSIIMLPRKLKDWLEDSPLAARLLPFGVFLLLTAGQGRFGEESAYWFYLAKTVVGAWMVLAVRPLIGEMRWAFSVESVVVGVGVFVMWVGLEGLYPGLGQIMGGLLGREAEASSAWNPHLVFGAGTGLAWFFVLARVLGSTLVVPPLEEVVFRSTLYRYVVDPDFLKVSMKRFHWGALLFSSLIFALQHEQWLAGFLCGAAYQWLVIRKGRLGDAMTAHTITNFLLAGWVVFRDAWQFW